MKTLLLFFTLISCNASAVEFPSKEVNRQGIPGNLQQTAATKLDCIKKVAEAALNQMQIKGLELTQATDQRGAMNGRNFDLTFKDKNGKAFVGSVQVNSGPSPDGGVICRPRVFDVADGEDGNLYHWQATGKDSGSVRYIRAVADDEPPKTAKQLCADDPPCMAQARAAMQAGGGLGMVPSANPTTMPMAPVAPKFPDAAAK